MASCSLINSDREIELASWVEHTIQNEIQRGVKQREQKVLPRGKEGDRSRLLKKPSLAASVHPATSLSSDKQTLAMYGSSNVSRKQSPRFSGMDNVRKRATSNSPTHFSTRSSPQSGRRVPVCSMRISQLAVPTKRQCIETWRNKAYVLPEFMVHRLKQQVMDQTPVVHISDAVTCFKYKTPDKMTPKNRPQRKINKEAMKRRESEQNKSLSVLFGNKLLARLTKPTKITLIPRLETLATVVATDICYMMRDRRLKHIRVNDDIHELMVREVSEKVTIWIAQILEDTKEKLLEEALRVKKMNERIPATVNGEVMTLMNALIIKDTDLEEEEGPVLDVLDDVVDNVLDICIPLVAEESDDRDNKSTDNLFTELDEEGPALDVVEDVLDNVLNTCIPSVAEDDRDNKAEASDDRDNKAEASDVRDNKAEASDVRDNKAEASDDRDNKSSDYLSMTSETSSDDNDIKTVDAADSITKHLMKQLELIIIDTIKSNENLDFDDVAKGQPNFEEKKSGSDLTPLDDTIKEETQKNQIHTLKSESFQSVTSHLDNDREVTLSTVDDIMKPDEEKSSNVSDALEISLSEEEKNKKVKFSHDDIGHLKGSSRQSKNSNPELYYHTDVAAEKNPSEFTLGSFRNIGDTWPKDLSSNILKPSASAIMSITSLGRILELEEKNLLSIEMVVSTEQLIAQPAVNAEPVDTRKIVDSPEEIDNLDLTKISNEAKQVFIEQTAAYVHNENEEFGQRQDLIDVKVSNEQKEELDIEKNLNDDKIVDEYREPVSEPDSNDDTTRDEAKGDDSNKIETINLIDNDDTNEEYDDTREIDIYQDLWERIDSNLKNKVLSADPYEEFYSNMTKKGTVCLENTVMNKIGNGINHASSKHSLVSEILFEVQTYEGKLLDMRAIERYISKIRCQCGESDHDKQSEIQIGQMHQQNSKSQETATAMANTFDYRVHPETAPSWLTDGKGEPGGGGKDLSYSGKKPIKERERDIMKWCDDLDNILNNLSKWKTWLDYITKYITTLKQTAELKTLGGSNIVTLGQLKPPNTLDKDVMKPNSNKRTKCGLKLYRNDETVQFKILPTTMATKRECCICTTQKTKPLRASRSPTKK